ncbi:MFS transporter [Acinetobacter pittii]
MNTINEKDVIKKVLWRIIPFIFILYIIAYLDRVNIGYAALDMNSELNIDSKMFGLATGIFFIGYFLFEIPSNILLEKFGARKWIARILISWGALVVLMGFVQTIHQLYILRFLLGIAEAGFFPGIMLYLTYWFRQKDQGQAYSWFLAAIPISFIIGAPLSTWIMDNIQWYSMSGWRWMFIIEGLPAILLGFITLFYMVDSPSQAKWLTIEEKNWLNKEIEIQNKSFQPIDLEKKYSSVFKDKNTWIFAFILLLFMTGNHGISYWMPQIIKSLNHSLSNTEIGFIATLPYICGAIAMIFWSKASDTTGERKMFTAFPILLAAICLCIAGLSSNAIIAMCFITLSMIGLNCFKAPFFALRSEVINPAYAAVSLALINSIGNLGGTLGSYAVGLTSSITGNVKLGLVTLSISLIFSFILVLTIRTNKQTNIKKVNTI